MNRNRMLWNQPLGLWVLSAFEAFERFSYYAMRSLLVLYLLELLSDPSTWNNNQHASSHHDIPSDPGNPLSRTTEDRVSPSHSRVIGISIIRAVFFEPDVHSEKEVGELASRLYGAYTALAYLLSPLAGLLADLLTGQTVLILCGASVITCGHLLLAFDPTFLLGLLSIAIGTALVKPNVSTQVGMLFPQKKDEQRKQRAFSVFYVAINIGAFISPLIAGALHSAYGFGPAFLSAAAGMLLSLLMYVFGFRSLPPDARRHSALQQQHQHTQEVAHFYNGTQNDGKEKFDDEEDGVVPNVKDTEEDEAEDSTSRTRLIAREQHPAALDAEDAALIHAHTESEQQQYQSMRAARQRRMLAIITVCGFGIAFWAVYEQQGNSVQRLFANGVNRSIGDGVKIPAEFVQALNPVLILGLTPLLNQMWQKQARHDSEPSQLMKMTIGTLVVSGAYAVLALGASIALPMNPLWVCWAITLWTTGELFTSPTALSWVTTCAPPTMRSFSMSLWLFCTGIGNFLAGILGSLFVTEWSDVFFALVALIAAVCGSTFFLTRPALEALARGDAWRAHARRTGARHCAQDETAI